MATCTPMRHWVCKNDFCAQIWKFHLILTKYKFCLKMSQPHVVQSL